MSNIDKRATELLIENGLLVADTLRHLADNEIDSDYFAICHTNENGTEMNANWQSQIMHAKRLVPLMSWPRRWKPQRSGLQI